MLLATAVSAGADSTDDDDDDDVDDDEAASRGGTDAVDVPAFRPEDWVVGTEIGEAGDWTGEAEATPSLPGADMIANRQSWKQKTSFANRSRVLRVTGSVGDDDDEEHSVRIDEAAGVICNIE